MKHCLPLLLFALFVATQAGCDNGHASACPGPDPAVDRIEFSAASSPAHLRVTVVLRNHGGTDFASLSGSQTIALFEGRRLLAERSFDSLSAGRELPVEFEIPADLAEGARYEAAILYDPNIYSDATPANDDCNRTNNRLQARAPAQ